jgi:hypothetical protein
MTDAFQYLCLVMDEGCRTVSAEEANEWPENGFRPLLAMGVFLQAENRRMILCPDCLDHFEDVICVNRPDRSPRWYIPCPNNGRVEIHPDELRQWRISLPAVVQAIAGQLNLTGKFTELVPGHVWRLGRWKEPGGVHDILFAVGLNTAAAGNLRRAISGAHRPLVLIPHREPVKEFWLGKLPPLISLHAAATFTNDRILLDPEYVLDVVRQEQFQPAIGEIVGPEQLRLMVRRMIRTEGQIRVDDEILLKALQTCGSVRKAAAFLTEELKQSVTKDRVQRAVDRAGGLAAVTINRDSDSVVRSRGRTRRDTTPEQPA